MSLITIKGLVTHYKNEGSGKPLLLLHGWGGSGESFYALQKELSAHYSVITLDFPGFGETDPPPTGWDVQQYADFILAFLDAIDITTCAIAGHSFGGRVAIFLASKHPKRCTALILMAAAGIKHAHSAQERAAGFMARMGRRIISLPGLNKLQKPARSLFYKLIRRQDYFLAQGVMRETMKKVIDQDLSPLLKTIVLPTLIIWGDKDNMTPLEDAYTMHKEIKHSQLRIIQGGSHYLPRKYPHKLAEFMNTFLAL